MEYLHKIVDSEELKKEFSLPPSLQNQKLEVIILPIEKNYFLQNGKNNLSYSYGPITNTNRDKVNRFIEENWFSQEMVVNGTIVNMSTLEGIVCYDQNLSIIGLLTYLIRNNTFEIISLDSKKENIGIGTELLNQAKQIAKTINCKKIYLNTTNDNLHALHFYQCRGFTLSALHVNSISKARQLKPTIPAKGDFGIPIRDEIELEFQL